MSMLDDVSQCRWLGSPCVLDWNAAPGIDTANGMAYDVQGLANVAGSQMVQGKGAGLPQTYSPTARLCQIDARMRYQLASHRLVAEWLRCCWCDPSESCTSVLTPRVVGFRHP